MSAPGPQECGQRWINFQPQDDPHICSMFAGHAESHVCACGERRWPAEQACGNLRPEEENA